MAEADDVVLLMRCRGELEDIIENVIVAANRMDLEINEEETELMNLINDIKDN